MDFLMHSEFQDFEHFASEARAWELDFVQLDRGRPSFELLLAGVADAQISRARFSRQLYQQGATPKWGRTFVIPMNPKLELEWFGRKVTGDDLLIFPNNGELVSLSMPQFDVVTYTLSHELIEELSELHELNDVTGSLDGSPVIRLESIVMEGLRKSVQQVLDEVMLHETSVIGSMGLADVLRRDLANKIILLALGERSELRKKPLAHSRTACVKGVIDLLNDGKTGMNVSDLCGHTHVSERTLQYAFKEQFGVTPKHFLRAWKLNKVRDMLHAQGAGRKISEVAGEFGFWHMGQFAADYRKMFDELPSHTVQRCY
jgi:AraC family ethanolamine operon transcriptional activator